MKMKAWTFDTPASVTENPLRLTDMATPSPDHDELLLRVSACGICRTDLHVVEGELPVRRSPLVPGHQTDRGEIRSAGFPLLPLQILWMNLVTDVFPALALAVEPASQDLMKQPPRDPDARLLSRRFMVLIGWQAGMLAALALGAYAWALETYGPGAHARTVALFAIIGAQLGHVFNCRSRTRSAFEGLFRNTFLWVATAIVISLQLLAVYFPPMTRVLGTVRPSTSDWLIVSLCVVTPVVIVEITKAVVRWKRVLIDGRASEAT